MQRFDAISDFQFWPSQCPWHQLWCCGSFWPARDLWRRSTWQVNVAILWPWCLRPAMLNQGTPCNPSQRHKALQSSQIDTPEARKEKHVKKMRNRSMTCSYNKVYSLVQEGESGQHGDLNQEHTESPDHLELHESAFEDWEWLLQDAEAPVTVALITFWGPGSWHSECLQPSCHCIILHHQLSITKHVCCWVDPLGIRPLATLAWGLPHKRCSPRSDPWAPKVTQWEWTGKHRGSENSAQRCTRLSGGPGLSSAPLFSSSDSFNALLHQAVSGFTLQVSRNWLGYNML